MITILHNPRCGKSRTGLQMIENLQEEITVRNYLKDPLNKPEIEKLLQQLDLTPNQIIRTHEKIWKDKYKNKDLTNEELIEILVEHPILIERPIVIKGDKAVIGRPPENITRLI
ncbi:MAG: arsenate reductase (glutaredoxin) [Flavobacterium sp.]